MTENLPPSEHDQLDLRPGDPISANVIEDDEVALATYRFLGNIVITAAYGNDWASETE